MSLLRASRALRGAASSIPKRHFAVAPTVKEATDTSGTDFPAPSHVSLTSTASELARQLTDFYSNPDSVIELSEETRAIMTADILKKVQTIPDSAITDAWASANVVVPEKIRIGDNPYFEVYKKLRDESKLA